MAILRVNKTRDYTVMSNYHFREREMSLKAKGLLSLMLSLPDDWDYSVMGLVSICKENETAITSTLKELKAFGYLTITKRMPNETESGRIEYVYDVYEHPQGANRQAPEIQHTEKQDLENLGLENLGVENQGVENQVQLITNRSSTKEKVLNNQVRKSVCGEKKTKKGKKPTPTPEEPRKAYGQFKNVLLTTEEFNALTEKTCDARYYIERLSLYMASTGKTYENHLAAMLSWWMEDMKEEVEKDGGDGRDIAQIEERDEFQLGKHMPF